MAPSCKLKTYLQTLNEQPYHFEGQQPRSHSGAKRLQENVVGGLLLSVTKTTAAMLLLYPDKLLYGEEDAE